MFSDLKLFKPYNAADTFSLGNRLWHSPICIQTSINIRCRTFEYYTGIHILHFTWGALMLKEVRLDNNNAEYGYLHIPLKICRLRYFCFSKSILKLMLLQSLWQFIYLPPFIAGCGNLPIFTTTHSRASFAFSLNKPPSLRLVLSNKGKGSFKTVCKIFISNENYSNERGKYVIYR